MKSVSTRRVRRILLARRCTLAGTEGSHELQTPGGLSVTIVAGDREQSPGLLRNIENVFAPEFGAKWLQKDLQK